MGQTDERFFRDLEEQLLEPVVRASADRLDALIADDFVEFASNGGVYDKPGISAAVRAEQARGVYLHPVLHDFAARRLSESVALVTYRAERKGANDTLRTSIWTMTGGRWQIVFHQGTVVPPS